MKIQISKFKTECPINGIQMTLCNKYITVSDIDENLHYKSDNCEIFLSGTFYYLLDGDEATLIDELNRHMIFRAIETQGCEIVKSKIEGHYHGLIIDYKLKKVSIFTDPLGRDVLFYLNDNQNSDLVFSDNLGLVVSHLGNINYNQMALYNYLLVGYSPGRDTFYENISRLSHNEICNVKLLLNETEFQIFDDVKVIKDYGLEMLDQYDKIFTESVLARSNTNNIIMNSGGWDSTAILSKLVDNKSENNVEANVIQVTLSDGEIFNSFEVDKVKRIGDFFDIKTDVSEVDYGNLNLISLYENSSIELRNKHVYFFINHLALFSNINKETKNLSVFNGETSDSIHNFGFSQFVSVNYKNLQLREIADKAKSYLYSPSFFKKLDKNKSFEQDEVWIFFKNYFKNSQFIDQINVSDYDSLFHYLGSFMLSYPRVPFAAWHNKSIAKEVFIEKHDVFMVDNYFNRYNRLINEDNFYYCLLEIYKDFHFQSSQIQINYVGANSLKIKPSLPFYDLRMMDFMSSMPENWGRGLELKTTKFPLRKLASEKWNMPLHILDEDGPHSYIAERDLKWSYSGGKWTIQCEILYRSVFKDYYRQKLSEVQLEDYFDPNNFNLQFLKKVIDDYINGFEDLENHALLYKLCLLFSIGFYK